MLENPDAEMTGGRIDPVKLSPQGETTRQRLPAWLVFSLLTIVLWGVWGALTKVVSADIDAYTNQVLFAIGVVPVMLPKASLHGHLTTRDFWLAVIGGTLNSLGAYTSFAALEKGGKASIVIPLCYLYPLLTILLAITFLHESLTRPQLAGIVLLIAAILLSQEAPPEADQAGSSL